MDPASNLADRRGRQATVNTKSVLPQWLTRNPIEVPGMARAAVSKARQTRSKSKRGRSSKLNGLHKAIDQIPELIQREVDRIVNLRLPDVKAVRADMQTVVERVIGTASMMREMSEGWERRLEALEKVLERALRERGLVPPSAKSKKGSPYN